MFSTLQNKNKHTKSYHTATHTQSWSRLCQIKYNVHIYFTISGYLVMAEALFNICQILLTNNIVFVNNLKNCLTNPI
jgi:hypothetical protein